VTPAVALSFHAERLQEAATWARVFRVVRGMNRWGVGATFFVYPFPARLAGCDLADRIRALAALGHEVGQHTHFYAGNRIAKREKANDFSDENVKHCIQRDFRVLEEAGARPRGFVAGNWVLTPKVLDILADLGFSYDCSARIPKPGRHDERPIHEPIHEWMAHEWMTSPRLDALPGGPLVRLPTSCSVGEWFRWARGVWAEGPEPFQIVYLHDYDLKKVHTRWLLRAFLRLNRGRLVPVGALPSRLALG
jgi:peptidoglycan/xylan/chitin deacetylase (PgdA/CDA1 family)